MQFSLFDDEPAPFTGTLPAQSKMPLNVGARHVGAVLFHDLSNDDDALVVTGYSGLEQLIHLITARGNACEPLRLLLGSDPSQSQNPKFSLKPFDFSTEVRTFWLQRGISITLSGEVLHCIELIRNGHVEVRYPTGSHRMHAKIYCGAGATTAGSSNFTPPGLYTQHEANLRFTSSDSRSQDVWNVAELFWSQGRDAGHELIALLERLLKFVTWQEALSRACAELLDSEWANHYLNTLGEIEPVSLWPAQRQGIGQALYLLDTLGGVLVADATGSGKTRLGAHLLRAVHDQNWSASRGRKGSMLMICPPLVIKNWEKETAKCGFNIAITSQGMLSRLTDKDASALGIQLGTAQTIAVDEAHNFLSQASKRTQRLKHNLADQVILFTATPINRSKADLLRMIDLLGPDNFDDDVLSVLERLSKGGKGSGDIHDQDLVALKKGIESFAVRRTKTQLNTMVSQKPEAYRASSGRVCRYPQQSSLTFELDEPATDRTLAQQIRDEAHHLKGISHFQKPLVLPDYYYRKGIQPELYLEMRLKSATSLATYHVMSSLRSSRLALFRHLEGEVAAMARLELHWHIEKKQRDDDIGNMLERITRLEGKIPENHLGTPLPGWLSDSDEHRKACRQEIEIYRRILTLLTQMSDQRESCKVKHLIDLLNRHDQVLAFDHYPITLRYLEHKLQLSRISNKGFEVVLGIGGSRRQHEQIQAMLDPSRKGAGRMIALCSDAMSEGVNLQLASALMHLDMPSVVRIAEQRVGRIDRMDSPHSRIECRWPKDSPEFALRSDETFSYRMEEVDSLIGSNLLLPDHLRSSTESDLIDPLDMIKKMEERARKPWDGIEDAFAPVKSLVSKNAGLVSTTVYDQFRGETAKVLSRVSVVKSGKAWIFLCLAGERARAPRWVLMTDNDESPLTHLREIAEVLRERLGAGVESLDPTVAAMSKLQGLLSRLSNLDKLLLPRRKRLAIEQFSQALKRWSKDGRWVGPADQAYQIHRLLDLIEGRSESAAPDWRQFADTWLELVQPRWNDLLKSRPKKTHFARLRDLEPGLKTNSIPAADLLQKLDGIDLRRPWEERIVACILGFDGAASP